MCAQLVPAGCTSRYSTGTGKPWLREPSGHMLCISNCLEDGHGDEEDDGKDANPVALSSTPAHPQSRQHPRAGRAREQPEGHQRRTAEAPADGVHRRLGFGQEFAGVRHHRGRVAAPDQRDLQRFRTGLHADAGAARGRCAGRADHGHHRRPGAHGRQRPHDLRHRHRRQRDAAHPVQPAGQATYRCAKRVRLQRSLAAGGRCRDGGARRGQDQGGQADLQPPRRHVPALRGHGLGQRYAIAIPGCLPVDAAHKPSLGRMQ